MIMVRYNKTRAQEILQCLNTRQPIPPPAEGWSGLDLTLLAGVCASVAFSQGPLAQRTAGIDVETLPVEHVEAIAVILGAEVDAAIDYCRLTTDRLLENDFDRRFEEEHVVLIRCVDEERQLEQVRGVKPGGFLDS